MITADYLCKKFERNVKEGRKTRKEEFYAVDHISLKAGSGEIIGILGPNGAGKTTFLRMLGMLMTPDEGEIIITDDAGNILEDPVQKKAAIGYLSGNTKMYPRFSIREYLEFLGELYGFSKEKTQERIREIVDVLNMAKFADNRIERLSTGQLQRASIARCLFADPDIYILDEPTLGLDILSADAIIHFMKKQKERRKTVLYSTHYLEEAQFLCDYVYLILDGKIAAEGTPADLMGQTGTGSLRETFHVICEKAGFMEKEGSGI